MKPLLRRASAYEALEKYPLAYVDYKTVLQIDDSVKAALEGINRWAWDIFVCFFFFFCNLLSSV